MKPGDYIVHDNTGLKTFNHVVIINTVKHDGDKAVISTVESCSDSGVEGLIYTTGISLTGKDGKFEYFRLNRQSRKCFVRRINHWYDGQRHDLTDVQLG